MTPRQKSNMQYCIIRKQKRLQRGLTGIIFLIVLIGCFGCSPDVNNSMPDKVEFASVWQYLKVYSIYQDKIADDPFTYNSIGDMFRNLGDTLKGDMYTRYFPNAPDWLAKSSASDVIVSELIDTCRLTDSCYLLRISTFDGEPELIYKEFESVLSGVSKYKNIIVDLRNNTGGDLKATDYVIEDMLPAGIRYIRTKERVINKSGITVDSVWSTKRAARPEFLNKKFAVLVDGKTASAAEVLALALKDGVGAPMFGKRTYGKGIGQTRLTRRDRLWLMITCMHFYRINDSFDYHRVGISPDTPSAQLVSDGPTDENNKYIYYAVKTLQPSVQKEQITYPQPSNRSAPDNSISGMYKYADEHDLIE